MKGRGSVSLHVWPCPDVWCVPSQQTQTPAQGHWGCRAALQGMLSSLHTEVSSVPRLSGVGMKHIPVLVLTIALSSYWTAHTNTAHKIRERITTVWPDKVLPPLPVCKQDFRGVIKKQSTDNHFGYINQWSRTNGLVGNAVRIPKMPTEMPRVLPDYACLKQSVRKGALLIIIFSWQMGGYEAAHSN